MSIRRHLLGLLLSVGLASGMPRAGGPEACDVRGPLGDFWPKVIRDWSRRIPGLNFGPTQTAAWVSLVYGSGGPQGEDHRLEEFVRGWAGVQEWNWVRSEIWKRPYERIAAGRPEGRQGFRQNLILVGTPATNPLISRALQPVGIRARPDAIEIGGRTYRGGDLLLVAIAPSPFARPKYVLCVVGLSREALLGLTRVPFGETDYVLFRGRRVIESGFFDKPKCDSWGAGKRVTLSPDHRGWTTLERGFLRYHFDPSRTRHEEIDALAGREEAAIRDINAVWRFARSTERIEVYVYVSADEKLRETADGRLAHLEEGASAIHRVLPPGSDPAFYPACLLLIRRHLGAQGLPGLRLAMALATSPEFEGRPLEEWGSRLIERGEEPGLAKLLTARQPVEGEDLRRVLAAASFLRFLISEGRVGEVKQLYLNSRLGSLAASYRDLLGESLDRTERRWAVAVVSKSPPALPAVRGSRGRVRAARPLSAESVRRLERARSLFRGRQDGEARDLLGGLVRDEPSLAEAHLLLARIHFRSGDAANALREARRALETGGDDPEVAAWAHVTLGRAEAVLGHPSAAALELRDPSLARGPDAPRNLADLWLENLGLSPNRKTVEEQLTYEARADLQNFDWDSAERKLRAILATNPDSPEAHFALSEVYLRHHSYWVERARLTNELHPGTTLQDPAFYAHLADRANREVEKALILSTPELSERKTEGNRHALKDAGAVAGLDLFDPSIRIEGGHPSEFHNHFFQGRAHFFASEWGKARQELELSLSRDGRHQRIVAWDLIYLGFIDLFEGRTPSARTHFEAARSLRIGGRVTAAAKKGLAMVRSTERSGPPVGRPPAH